MVIYKEKYGEDIDGNRGITVINAEIDSDDTDDIKAQLEMLYDPEEDEYTVTLYCHQFDTEIDFEVNINDYLTPTEIKGLT